jgi:hypothetical protein
VLLTPEQLHEIQEIIRNHHAAFVVNNISPDAVPQDVLDKLSEAGLIDIKAASLEDSYLLGAVAAVLEDPSIKNMSYDDFKAHVRKNPIPLSRIETQAIQFAQMHGAQMVQGLGNKAGATIGSALIEADEDLRVRLREEIQTQTAENIAKRQSVRQLKSALGNATKDWARDWDRIAITEKHNAMMRGLSDKYLTDHGTDVRVAFRPMPDACKKCKELHLGDKGVPYVFKLSDIEGNGSNFGKKQAEWKPVIGAVHPHCQCQMVRVPEGWGFDESGSLVPGGEEGQEIDSEADLERSIRFIDEFRKSFKLQGRARFQGLDIAIENKAGTVRKWTDPEGNEGETHMMFAYGYIEGTEGPDGDEIDVYLGPYPKAKQVFVVEQNDPGGEKYDEVKCFLGFANKWDAEAAYHEHMAKAPKAFNTIQAMDMDGFKRWIENTKPKQGEMAKSPALVIPLEPYREEKLEKAGKEGGKYIKKVPYTDSKGKRRYRYYYNESASAREAVAGEEIKLGKRTVKVSKVHKNGDLTLTIDGESQKVTPDKWHDLMKRHYGKAYTKSAEKRAKQTINAVLRHVPRDLLKELKGETDKERLKDLQKRVPAVYDKLKAAYRRAGMSPYAAKRSISRTLERRGWEPEARALVIGNVIKTPTVGTKELIDASESLAGGRKVEARHVSAVVEMRSPQGKPEAFKANFEATEDQARNDLERLSLVLSQVEKGEMKAEQALATVLESASIGKLQALTSAFPAVKSEVSNNVEQTLKQVADKAPKTARTGGTGDDTVVYVAGEGGKPKPLAATYKLVEAKELVASHDPTSFAKRKDYPSDVQERAYHRDKSEQAKVIRNAQNMDPRFVVNTNPDAVNGPPIVTDKGIVLGGNSRTMSMQRIYENHPEKAAEMKAYLAKQAHEVGLSAADVEGMQNPVLVRVMTPEDDSTKAKQILVRQMNESFTQGMDPRTMQVAMGRKLSTDAVQKLADSINEDETLSAFLSSKRSEPFVNALFRAGIIDDRNANQYMVKGTRTLNNDGKQLVSRILVGRTVEDADILSDTGTQMMEAVAKSIPSMVQATAHGEGYDVSGSLKTAIDAFNDLQRKSEQGILPALDANMSAKDFATLDNYFQVLPGIGEPHPVLDDPKAHKLLEVLIRKRGPIQMAKVFREYAKRASQNPEGQATMFGSVNPDQVFMEAMDAAMGKKSDEKLAASFSSSSIELLGDTSRAGHRSPSFSGTTGSNMLFNVPPRPPASRNHADYRDGILAEHAEVKHGMEVQKRDIEDDYTFQKPFRKEPVTFVIPEGYYGERENEAEETKEWLENYMHATQAKELANHSEIDAKERKKKRQTPVKKTKKQAPVTKEQSNG